MKFVILWTSLRVKQWTGNCLGNRCASVHGRSSTVLETWLNIRRNVLCGSFVLDPQRRLNDARWSPETIFWSWTLDHYVVVGRPGHNSSAIYRYTLYRARPCSVYGRLVFPCAKGSHSASENQLGLYVKDQDHMRKFWLSISTYIYIHIIFCETISCIGVNMCLNVFTYV